MRTLGPLLLLAASLSACRSMGTGLDPLPRIAAVTRGLERSSGFVDLFVDARRGTLWLELPPPDEHGTALECLCVEGLATGLGSNPIGLDRGEIGPTRVVRFRRFGGRVVVEAVNEGFRARSEEEAERRAAAESFATSVLWAGPVAAEEPDGRVLVDFTSFVVRDAHGVAAALEDAGEGGYALDRDRSALDPSAVLVFPDNVELEALLTFTGSRGGAEVRSVAPASDALTVVQHGSLVRLPDAGYEPRRHDPRAGAYGIAFRDYAAPLAGELDVRWSSRHRLKREGSASERSIVYYVDRGAPEPVRSALVEGASWWADAFAAAGFPDAFRVELLPEGAHPLDVRYDVIQWVHRATRGWSYGGAVIDPRTGEILKGHVSLGSLRVRHDRLLFEGLLGAQRSGSGAPDDPVELALARIRQLAAHEVGHTLGFAHNFAASTNDRASVMDYPAPLVRLADGALDVSQAYGVGVGAWDRFAVAHLYGELDEDARDALVDAVRAQELLFLSDEDARPPGAGHPLANLWDNGADPVDELLEVMAVRRFALARFGAGNLAPGRDAARLEEVLAPLWFWHRYQLEAATKVIGGVLYGHERADAPPPWITPVPAEDQRAALASVLAALEPAELDLPEGVLALLVPPAPGEVPGRERFASRTAPAFDALGAAASLAELVVSGLLQPERCARLVDQHRRDPESPSLAEVLAQQSAAAFPAILPDDPRLAELQAVVQRVVVDGLLGLARDGDAAPEVRWRVEVELARLLEDVRALAQSYGEQGGRLGVLEARIERWLERVEEDEEGPPRPAPAPPGSPIGGRGQASCASG